PGSTVRVVSDGYVFGVQPLQGYGDLVFVNHGTFRTAYGNMSNIFVRKNQVLSQGDVIGLSGDQNSIRGPLLFFLIREGNQMADPERWLQNPRP
ncbi:MAG: peptidoglycan DD-metalloendopeptidase family protein, partial [Balneolaceae bacterium]